MNSKRIFLIIVLIAFAISTLAAEAELIVKWGETVEEAKEAIQNELIERINNQFTPEYRSILLATEFSDQDESSLFNVYMLSGLEYSEPVALEQGGYNVAGKISANSYNSYYRYAEISLQLIEIMERELELLRSPKDDDLIEEYLIELLTSYEDYDYATLMIKIIDDENEVPKLNGTKEEIVQRYTKFIHRNDWMVDLSEQNQAQLAMMQNQSESNANRGVTEKSSSEDLEEYEALLSEYQQLQDDISQRAWLEFEPILDVAELKIEEIQTKEYRPAELIGGKPTEQAQALRQQAVDEIMEQLQLEAKNILAKHQTLAQGEIDSYIQRIEEMQSSIESTVYTFTKPVHIIIDPFDPELNGWSVELSFTLLEENYTYRWLLSYEEVTKESYDQSDYDYFLDQVDLFNAFLLLSDHPLLWEYLYTISIDEKGTHLTNLEYTLFRGDNLDVLVNTKVIIPEPAKEQISEIPKELLIIATPEPQQEIVEVVRPSKKPFNFNKIISIDQRTYDAFFTLNLLFKEWGSNNPNDQFIYPSVGLNYFPIKYLYVGAGVGFAEKKGSEDGIDVPIFITGGATVPFTLSTFLISPFIETNIGVNKTADTLLKIGANFTTHYIDAFGEKETGFTVGLSYTNSLSGPHAGFTGISFTLAYSKFW